MIPLWWLWEYVRLVIPVVHFTGNVQRVVVLSKDARVDS